MSESNTVVTTEAVSGKTSKAESVNIQEQNGNEITSDQTSTLPRSFVSGPGEVNQLEEQALTMEITSASSAIRNELDLDMNGNPRVASSQQPKLTNDEFVKWMNRELHYLEPGPPKVSSAVTARIDTEVTESPSSTFQVTLRSPGTTIDVTGGCKTPSSTGTPPPPEFLSESMAPKDGDTDSTVSVPTGNTSNAEESQGPPVMETSQPVETKPPTTEPPVEKKPPTDPPVEKKPPTEPPVEKKPPTESPVEKKPPTEPAVEQKPPSDPKQPTAAAVKVPVVSKAASTEKVPPPVNGTNGTAKGTGRGAASSKTGSSGAVNKKPATVTAPQSTTPTKGVGSPARSSRRASAPQTPTTPSDDANTNKKVPMNKVKVGTAPSPNIKEVKSKVGSLANPTAPAAGVKKQTSSTVKIPEQKLNWNATSKVGSFNTTYVRKGGDVKVKVDPPKKVEVKEVTSKVGSWNVSYKPGGGEKKIFDDKQYLKKTQSNSSSEHVVSDPNTPPPRATSSATNTNGNVDGVATDKEIPGANSQPPVPEQKLIDA